ncbi:MAG: hypothetical protein ACYTFI_09590 [Planctomycetota bacterium]
MTTRTRRKTRSLRLRLVALVVLPVVAHGAAGGAASAERIDEIARMLPERPAGLGRPAADRAAWERLAGHEAFRGVIKRAEAYLVEPLPELPDELFLDFSRTGNRTRWQRAAGRRDGRLSWLVIGECLENRGRFIGAFEELVRAICKDKTWVMPAHDRRLTNFKGTSVDIDLRSAAMAWSLATARHLLGGKLGPAVSDLIRENVRRRVLDPFRDMAKGKRKGNWWTRTTNNWNAVCLAGVTGAALATIEDREGRALFVAAAEKYSESFLKGFAADGYCTEGLGYWNYGFGHYVLLAEVVHQATGALRHPGRSRPGSYLPGAEGSGRDAGTEPVEGAGGGVDLMARKTARLPAEFGARIEIMSGVSPAFADCSVGARPSARIMSFVSRRFRLGLGRWEADDTASPGGALFESMIYSFPNSVDSLPRAERKSEGLAARTWFDDAGILISRPGALAPDQSPAVTIAGPGDKGACRLGVALKGGHNAEHHNHNDVGSYVVVVGTGGVLVDPGAEVYTARTFSGRRYDSKVLNSWGHPVPVVAGKLQKTGRKACGRVVRTDFTDLRDTLVLDISSAYGLREIAKLERTFVYSREGAGSLTVTDEVELKEPREFGTALVTLGRWKKLGTRELLVYDLDGALRVTIDTGGAEFEVRAEEIKEDVRTRTLPTRIGIDLKRPVARAKVALKVAPAEFPGAGKGEGLLRNGGFELGSWGWSVPKPGMGSLSGERAASGETSLRILDADGSKGSSVSSARSRVEKGGTFELRGRVFPVSGSGLGVYVKIFDANGKMLNETNARGHISDVVSLGGSSKRWEPFGKRFAAPEGTAFLQVWIHSYNAALVEAFLDEIEIVRVEE